MCSLFISSICTVHDKKLFWPIMCCRTRASPSETRTQPPDKSKHSQQPCRPQKHRTAYSERKNREAPEPIQLHHRCQQKAKTIARVSIAEPPRRHLLRPPSPPLVQCPPRRLTSAAARSRSRQSRPSRVACGCRARRAPRRFLCQNGFGVPRRYVAVGGEEGGGGGVARWGGETGKD